MKKLKVEKQFIEELSKIPIISHVCERIGISRESVYRWMRMDPKFKANADEALSLGRESLADLAESKLVGKVKEGHFPSIKLVLNANRSKYYGPQKAVNPVGNKITPVTTINHFVINAENKHLFVNELKAKMDKSDINN